MYTCTALYCLCGFCIFSVQVSSVLNGYAGVNVVIAKTWYTSVKINYNRSKCIKLPVESRMHSQYS